LPERTIFRAKIKGRYVPFDVSGYPIASAIAILKGYDLSGNKNPKTLKEIPGYYGPIL
jgi:hypothetical protein